MQRLQWNKENCTPTRVVAVQQPSLPRWSKLEEALPMPFALPKNFPPLVAAGLQAKSLNGKAAVKFISEIAHAVFRFKSYPTRDEKEPVARQCVKAYPFLEANSGTGHVSQEIYVTDIMNTSCIGWCHLYMHYVVTHNTCTCILFFHLFLL